MESFAGRRVTILGLGRFGGGAGAARWFAGRGAKVLVSDSASEESLKESVESLNGLAIEFHLGGHRKEDLTGADLVIANPAVPPGAEPLAWAKEAGVAVDTEINLFFRTFAGDIVGVTGSNGKSTTTALTASVLRADGRRVFCGGNLGGCVLEGLDLVPAPVAAVLELSSFQLESLASLKKSPHVAVVTNLTPNHLDRHKTMEEYAKAKQTILRHQASHDLLVLNGEDPETSRWGTMARGARAFIGQVPEGASGALYAWRGGEAFVRRVGSERRLFVDTDLRIPGAHNRRNALAAAAVGDWFSMSPGRIADGLRAFLGLPDRLEFVSEVRGVRYINDSCSTTPESTIEGLRAYEKPVLLILGGKDKGMDLDAIVREASLRARQVFLVGKIAPDLLARFQASAAKGPLERVVEAGTLDRAVKEAAAAAASGETVLLSPAFASTDQFRNYQERAAAFKRLVGAL